MKTSFTKLVGALAGKDAKAQMWRPVDRSYPRLTGFDAAAANVAAPAGIYAVWHLGVRPQWLRVGATANLAAAFGALAGTPWIVAHEGNAGIYVAWAHPADNQCAGMVRYLAETLKPAFQLEPFPGDRRFDPAVATVACPLPPGTQS